MTRRLVIAVVLAAIVAVAALSAYYFVRQPAGPCMPLGGARILKSKVTSTEFDALTEYSLPSPSRWSNAITVAQDGSVWFGEQSVPGVAHLFLNGTLVEYAWPSASHPSSKACGFETSIWGVAVWNGMVWGTDGDGNALVGINPQTGAARVINVTGTAGFPYTLSIAPDGSLWFTSLDKPATLGRIGLDYSVTAIHVNNVGGEFPAELDFVNSSYAYMVALNTVNDTGHLYSFDPAATSSSINPQVLGGNYQLQYPNSIAVGGGSVWVAQHGPSSLAALDVKSGTWTLLPTTSQKENITTLPYFVAYGNDRVWFNEHYGNRIGFIDSTKQVMTEYSESNPPVTNASEIGNDLTIAPAPLGLWFTSVTGNYIGFANASYVPDFGVSIVGGDSASVPIGGQVGLNLTVGGSWKSALSVILSDTETYTDIPASITMTPSEKLVPAESGLVQLQVEVSVGAALKPGEYTLALTVSDGLVLRTAFFYLNVT